MNRPVLIAAVAAAVVIAGGVGAYLAARPASSGPAPTSFTIHGSLSIANNFAGSIAYGDGTSCHGGGGFADLQAGTAVQVANATGQTIATGALGWSQANRVTMSAPAMGIPSTPVVASCEMSFTIPDVPDGLPSYTLTISHRPPHVVQAGEAHERVQLSIG